MTVLSDQIVAKAERLLTTGCVKIELPAHGRIGTIVGDSGIWTIARGGDGAYICSCPALGICSHLLAIAMVTA